MQTALDAVSLQTERGRLELNIAMDRATTNPAKESEMLAQFLRGHIGVLHSREHAPGGAWMSEASGKKFTAGLVAQRRQPRQ